MDNEFRNNYCYEIDSNLDYIYLLRQNYYLGKV